jgi:hypothetical protein
MCDDLGPDWLQEYETFYRYASIPTHAGAFTMESTLKSLLDQQPPTSWEKAKVLITASALHLRLTEIAAKTFPNEINIEKVQVLRDECSLLGKEIANA